MASIPLAILSSSISSFNRAQSACDGDDDDDDDDDDDALAAVAVMLMTIREHLPKKYRKAVR